MNRIRELRKAADMTMKQLGNKIGVHESTVSLYESEKRQPDIEILKKIAEVFDCSIDYILCRNSENLAPVKNKILSSTKIPVLGEVPAGIPIESIEFIVDEIDLPENLARDDHDYFALLVSGNSMYPEYMDGDMVIIRKQETAESGDDAVVYINGYNATLKRVIVSPRGLTLRALNPEFETKMYSNEEIKELNIKIAGIVVEQRRNRK